MSQMESALQSAHSCVHGAMNHVAKVACLDTLHQPCCSAEALEGLMSRAEFAWDLAHSCGAMNPVANLKHLHLKYCSVEVQDSLEWTQLCHLQGHAHCLGMHV